MVTTGYSLVVNICALQRTKAFFFFFFKDVRPQ